MKFVVNGGERLNGEIEVRGSKNAATPILAATLLTERPCVIKNLPLIGDVLNFIEILKEIGASVEWVGDRDVRIINKDIDITKLNNELVCKMRSSILLLGPILARFGEIKINFKESTIKHGYSGAKPNKILIGIYPKQDVNIVMNTCWELMIILRGLGHFSERKF